MSYLLSPEHILATSSNISITMRFVCRELSSDHILTNSAIVIAADSPGESWANSRKCNHKRHHRHETCQINSRILVRRAGECVGLAVVKCAVFVRGSD